MASINITITVDEELLAIIDEAAKKDKRTRSNYLVVAALEKSKRD